MAYRAGAVHLYFTVLGHTQISEQLEGMVAEVSDWSPSFHRMAQDFRDEMERMFASQGAAGKDGKPWAPLSRPYQRWKRKHYPGRRILTREGWLRASLTTRSGRGAIHRVTRDSLTVGTSLMVGDYNLGEIHHEGRSVPRRKIIHLNEAAVTRWVGYVQQQMNWENVKK